MKLSEYDTDISTNKTYISNFYFCDLRSGHFRDLPIIIKWATNKPSVLCFSWSLFEWNRYMQGIY